MESKKTVKRRAKKARRLERLNKEKKKNRLRLFVALGFIFIISFVFLCYWIRFKYILNHDDFVTVKAVITEKKLIPHKLSYWPMIVLEYTYNGKEYSSEQQVSRKNYEHTQVGDSLMIPVSVQHGVIDPTRVDILKEGFIMLE